MRFSSFDLKRALLKCFAAEPQHQHRINVLGRRIQSGALEYHLGTTFTTEERAAAAQALKQLEDEGLIRPTYTDLVAPTDWLEITATGREALTRDALDPLDEKLATINPDLLDLRHGSWSAVNSTQPDTIRQAAHSGRELVRQTLDALAPDAEVLAASWHQGSTVTRRDRLKITLDKRHGQISESQLGVIEAQCDVVEASYTRLSAIAHADVEQSRAQTKEILKSVEAALNTLL